MASEVAAPPTSENERTARSVPPVWYWLLIAFLIGANIWARLPDTLDHAIANIIAAAAIFLATLVYIVWFALFSRHSAPLRWTALPLYFAAPALFFALFRVDHLS